MQWTRLASQPMPGIRICPQLLGLLVLGPLFLGGCSSGNAHCARLDPQLVACPAPKRPPGKELKGGHVVVKLMVLPNGTVAEPHIVSSSGSPAWGDAVLHAVKRWEFKPSRHGYSKVIPFDFRPGAASPGRSSSTLER